MRHWAFDLIGQEWPLNACWSFVQRACAIRLQVDMPGLEVLHEAVSGWVRRPVPTVDHIVVMRGPRGRHSGFVIEDNGRMSVLHATDGMIQHETFDELRRHGYGEFKFWGLQ